MSTQEKVSDRLKRLRHERDETQESLARVLGFTRSYISQIEAGVKEPGPRFLREIARWEGSQGGGSVSGARGRLAALRARSGLSVADLAKKIGYEIGVLQALESGSARISEKCAHKLAVALGCSVDDLLEGSDHPPIINDGPGIIGTVGQKPDIATQKGLEARYVPLISWAQAGVMKNFFDENYQYEGHLAFNVSDRKAIALQIRGDSMRPQFDEGDVAILYPSHEARNGDLVVSRLSDEAGGDVMFKVFHSKSSGETVVLTSYNPTFPPLEYKRSEFQWIYPVASVVKNFRR